MLQPPAQAERATTAAGGGLWPYAEGDANLALDDPDYDPAAFFAGAGAGAGQATARLPPAPCSLP